MAKRRAPLWRTALSVLFLLLFCLAAPLALITGWARLIVNDPEAYAQTSREVAGDPRVRDGLAQAVTLRTQAMLSGENPTATEAIQSRVVAQALGDATREVVASEEFVDVWEAANRTAYHWLFTELSEGWGRPAALDLSPLSDPLQVEVDALDLDLPFAVNLDPADLQIEVLDGATADRVRRAVPQLDVAFWAALAATVVSLFLSLALAADRLAALARVAFGLAIAMVVAIALLLVGQSAAAATATGDPGARAVLIAIVDAISQGLRLSAIGLALGGLLLAGVFAGLAALRG